MDFLTVDPTFTQDCSVYNVPPLFIALGALVIVVAGLLLGYSLVKSPISALTDGYKKQKDVTGVHRTNIVLLLQLIRLWRPLTIISVLLFFMVVFIINASNIIMSLVKSGCV